MENRRCLNTDTGRQSGIVAQLIGNYQEGTKPKKLGIFHIPTDSEVNFNLGQDSRVASRGSFLGLVNVLGFKNIVNVDISQDGLKFRTKGKIHDMFDVSAIFNSRLVSWNDQRFTATGVFEGETVDGSLHRVLENELTRYSTEILAKVEARLELSTETEERAKYRLREVQILQDEWLKKFQEVKKEYDEAEYQLDSAEYNLNTLLELAEEFSDEIQLLKDELNKLCKVKHCPKICQKGRSCYTCWEYVISTKMGKCPATCHNTKQERIAPFIMDAICKNEHCKRIHTVHSWLGDLLGLVVGVGGTLLGLPPQISFGIGRSVSKFTRSVKKGDLDFGALTDGVTGILSAAGASKEFLGASKVFSSVAKGNRNLGSIAGGLVNSFSDHFPEEIQQAYKDVKNIRNKFESVVKHEFISPIKDTIGSIVTDEIISPLEDKVGSIVKDEIISPVKEKAGGLLNSFADHVPGEVQEAYKNLKNIPKKIESVAKDELSAVKDKTGGLLNSFADHVPGEVQEAYKDLKNIPKKIESVAKDEFISPIKDNIGSIVTDEIISPVEDKIGSIVKDEIISPVKDKTESFAKDEIVTPIKHKIDSFTESEVISPVKDQKRIRSYSENQTRSHVKRKTRSIVEDKVISPAEDKMGSFLQGQIPSHTKDKIRAHTLSFKKHISGQINDHVQRAKNVKSELSLFGKEKIRAHTLSFKKHISGQINDYVQTAKNVRSELSLFGKGIKGKLRSFAKNKIMAPIKNKFKSALSSAAVSAAKKVVGKAVPIVGGVSSLVQKSEGHWECTFKNETCTKERFKYKYTHTPYTCEIPCEQRHIAKSIQKSCCSVVSCASFVANVTCISENAFCKKARGDALDQLLKVKANAAKILASLDRAQQNISFWERKMRRLHIKKRSVSRSLQAYKTATRSLEEAYNVTVENRKRKLKILARPLMLKDFFNKLGLFLVKVEDIKFKVRVSAKHNLTLLPINMTVSLNGTRHQKLSTILDFTNFNRSLRSITKDILDLYIGDVSRLSRKKRSIKNTNSSTEDSKFYTLQTFHRLCSEFSNHKQTLFEVFASLFNLSSEIQQFRENDTQKLAPSIANSSAIFERVSINQTKAKELGVDISYNSYSNVLESDPELLEAIGFQDDVLGETIEAVESSSKLLYKNWLATMENIFESISEECSGFDDCLKYTIDSLAEITFDASLINAEKLRAQIGNVETKVFNLTRQSDMSVSDALYISQDILQILENMTGVENVCAQAPNITEHPAPFTNLGVNDSLVLRCNATGDSLTYQWRFNGDILENQYTNILRLNRTSPLHSGNYSCDVSNHVAKATSILALVVISTRPLIVHHPAQRRNFILSEDDSLQCQVQKNARNITFQWWFKPFKSSFFMALPNETFSHLSFAPVKSHHEGWYFCNVSNLFSHTISKTSFVRVLKYTLPVPAAKLTLTVISKSRSSNKSVYYQDTLAKVLASRLPNTNNNSQRVEERIRELHSTGCRIITRHDGFDRKEICDWTFSAVGENVTSNATLTSATSQQMLRIISATFKIKKALAKLGNETNTGTITFTVNKTNYSVQKHSLGIMAMSLLCPKRQFLVENVYKCGKFFTHQM